MAEGIRLMDLRLRHCRFIVDETPGHDRTTYCGAQVVPGSSWCPTHRAICVVDVAPRQKMPAPRRPINGW